jgi:hypothetical protein
MSKLRLSFCALAFLCGSAFAQTTITKSLSIQDGTTPSQKASVSAGGAVKVDGSGATQPVSGTFWQVTQPVSGTFWQATQPVSIADGSEVTLGAKADAKSTATDTTAVSVMSVLKEISALEQAPASRAVTNAGTFATQSAQSGNWTMRLVGNGGAIIDFAGQNASAPANSILIGGEFNTSPTTITSGNASPLQMDSAGNLLIKLNTALPAGTAVIGHVIVDTAPTTAVTGTFWQATQPVSGTFWQATQPVSIADGSDTTLGAKADAKSTATDTTAVSVMSVLKEISALEQAPASRAVTNAGTFVTQSTLQTQTDTVMVGGVNIKEINGVTPLMGAGNTGTGSPRVTISSDQAAIAVTPGATENYLGFVGGKATNVSANFTRPADTTAYASGDLVANSTTAASVVPMNFTVARINDATGMIRRVRVKKSTTTTTNASFRVHLYQNDPSASTGISNGDNGAWLTKEAGYLGSCDVTIDKAFSDAAEGVGVPNNGTEVNFKPTSGAQTVYALLEARAAYTPGNAEVFTVTLETLQN